MFRSSSAAFRSALRAFLIFRTRPQMSISKLSRFSSTWPKLMFRLSAAREVLPNEPSFGNRSVTHVGLRQQNLDTDPLWLTQAGRAPR